MDTSKLLKKLRFVFMVTVLLSTMFKSTVFADDANPGKTVPPDPNRVLSPEEIKLRDAKYSALEQYLQERESNQSAPQPDYAYLVILPLEQAWREPDDAAHVNYCGPGATQVALDVRWPAASVYDINEIGVDERTNVGGVGTNMCDIAFALNSAGGQRINPCPDHPVPNTPVSMDPYLGGEFPNPNGFQEYWWDGVDDRDDLGDKLMFDIDSGYAMIAGVMTTNMPGWNGYTAEHIVAVIGYKTTNYNYNKTTVYYTETAAASAGYYGGFNRSVSLSSFWNFVSGLPTLAW